jgi:hypothetical protein
MKKGLTMQSTVLVRTICRLLIVSLLALPFSPAMAGMIRADQALAGSSEAAAKRASVLEVLARADVATQLQAQGVDPMAARARVASMTDEEVSALAGQIDTLPAGAMSTGAKWAIAIIIVAAIWYFYK